jgi:type I restriction enzyme S subunit
MGQAPSGTAYNNDGKGWPLIAGAGDFYESKPKAKKFTTEASKLSRDGDIVLGIRASIGEKVLADGVYCLGRGVAALRPKKSLETGFLWHWLDHSAPRLAAKAKGATFKQVNREDIGELEIALPALEEQKRIAEVLDKAEELRTKRRAALTQLDSLTQSLFLEMFGDPIENERRWDEVQVRDFVAGFESGKSLVADDEDSQESPYRVLKVSAVTSLRFRSDESKALPVDYIPPHSHIVRKGDLLFSRANTADLIGATAFVEEVAANLVLPDKLWRFVWHTPRNANPSFVRFLFQHPKFRHEIGKRATGTSGSMKNISQEKVLGIICALPPMELQEKFAQRVSAIEKLKATQRASLAELDTLFASLQHLAFRGDF